MRLNRRCNNNGTKTLSQLAFYLKLIDIMATDSLALLLVYLVAIVSINLSRSSHFLSLARYCSETLGVGI